MTAVLATLKVLLAARTRRRWRCSEDATFRIDSTYALDHLFGKAQAIANVDLVHRVLQAAFEVKEQIELLAYRVKGHSGQPSTRRADVMTDLGMQDVL